jgi:hypothetical protein
MLKMGSHDPFEYLKHQIMTKKRSKSQSVNLIPTHQKLGIAWK